MPAKLCVGVRYCGGCNSRYDRVAVVKKLKKLLPHTEFMIAEAAHDYDAVLVVNGCSTACADISDISLPPGRILPIQGWPDLMPTKKRLQQLEENKEGKAMGPDEILGCLPHRDPMLFLDAVQKLIPGEKVEASFFTGADRPEFAGHFPGNPIFPGTILMEMMAQAAGVLLLEGKQQTHRLPILVEVEDGKLRKPVLPDSHLSIRAAYIEKMRFPSWHRFRCQVFIQDSLAAEAVIVLALKTME